MYILYLCMYIYSVYTVSMYVYIYMYMYVVVIIYICIYIYIIHTIHSHWRQKQTNHWTTLYQGKVSRVGIFGLEARCTPSTLHSESPARGCKYQWSSQAHQQQHMTGECTSTPFVWNLPWNNSLRQAIALQPTEAQPKNERTVSKKS